MSGTNREIPVLGKLAKALGLSPKTSNGEQRARTGELAAVIAHVEQPLLTQEAPHDGEHLYGLSRSLSPLDGTGKDIIRALDARNWEVPGVEVTFSRINVKKGEVGVYKVRGANFGLTFWQIKGENPGENEIALSEITIPREELNIYDWDERSTTGYIVYDGDDWDRDATAFIDGNIRYPEHRENSITYSGARRPEGRERFRFGDVVLPNYIMVQPYEVGEAPYLVLDEYHAKGRADFEPERYYETAAVRERFDTWLKENVLQPIQEGRNLPTERQ